MYDGFSIGVRVETVTALFEPFAQFGEVVDLAVVDNPDALIFVVNRLVPAG